MSTVNNRLDFLSDDEIEIITGKQKSSAQKRALEKMRIPFLPRPDDTLLVLRSNVLRKFGIVERTQQAKNKPQPNFDHL